MTLPDPQQMFSNDVDSCYIDVLSPQPHDHIEPLTAADFAKEESVASVYEGDFHGLPTVMIRTSSHRKTLRERLRNPFP